MLQTLLTPGGGGLLSPRFLPQLAETRRDFVRIGEDLETATAKNAQVSRHKPGDAERMSHLLLATRKCFQHFSLDYCLQVQERCRCHVTSKESSKHQRKESKTSCSLTPPAQQLQDSAET